jgi:hypothetical protein
MKRVEKIVCIVLVRIILRIMKGIVGNKGGPPSLSPHRRVFKKCGFFSVLALFFSCCFVLFSLSLRPTNLAVRYFAVQISSAIAYCSTGEFVHCKKGYRFSRLQSGCHKPNSPWQGIIEIFLTRESLVSDIPSGDGKKANFFLQCIRYIIL